MTNLKARTEKKPMQQHRRCRPPARKTKCQGCSPAHKPSVTAESQIDFKEMFGVPTREAAIAVLIRLFRRKRVRGEGTAKKYWWIIEAGLLEDGQDILPGRRYHHLTPRCRPNMPYAGHAPANLLLIKKERHKKLHHWFGHSTLEEILLILLRLGNEVPRPYRLLRRSYALLSNVQNGQSEQERQKLISDFRYCLSFFSPGHIGAF